MGVGPQAGNSASISSADFNENGFIDEEDLQKIVLRLLKSDDVSEDLLMDVTHHVCIQRLKEGWDPGLQVVTQSSQIQAIFFGRDRSSPLQLPWGWAAHGALRSGYTVERTLPPFYERSLCSPEQCILPSLQRASHPHRAPRITMSSPVLFIRSPVPRCPSDKAYRDP